MRDVIRLGASLAQLAVALFLILAVLEQSATDALPIRDHIEESGTLKPGVTISVCGSPTTGRCSPPHATSGATTR